MRCIPLLAVLLTAALAHAQPLTTAFTFQGQLTNNAAPVSGVYDLEFRLFDSVTGGTQVGPTLCADNITVTAGQVATQLDFGSQFAGQQRFLEVAVRVDTGLNCANASGFTTLSPRQQLTATPNAVYSLNAASAANATTAQSANSANTAATASNAAQLNGQSAGFYTNAANLSGTLPSADLSGTYGAQLNLSNTSNIFQGSFSGSGSGLTGVPWSGITGAPASVLLQPSFPGTAQLGSLNITGLAHVDQLCIGEVAIPAEQLRVHNSGTTGTVYTGLFINDSPNGTAIYAINPSTTGASYALSAQTNSTIGRAIFAHDASTGSGNSAGVYTYTDSTGGSGLFASATSSTGTAHAIDAFANSDSGNAIYASANASSGPCIAVNAWCFSTSGTAVSAISNPSTGSGVALHAVGNSASGNAGWFQGPGADAVIINNTGNGRGMHVTTASDTAVWAESTTGLAGVDGRSGGSYGVLGIATATTGTVIGVYGQSNSAAGYGLYANGRFGASGTKAFRIDHPDDPQHKYLLHYSAESPEVINFYRGTITLNEQGEATIDLPPYFAKINKDPSYQLTAVGAAMPLLHVSTEISAAALEEGAKAAPQDKAPACSFTISGGAPNGKVCWLVQALRNDRWVQTHGAPVELAKEGPEDGTYQHPELYGQPAEPATRP
jgi:hypothetical protein